MPYNHNRYTFRAIPLRNRHGCMFQGHGFNRSLHKVWREIKRELNDRCIDGRIEENAEFEVIVTWKGAIFARIMVARSVRVY